MENGLQGFNARPNPVPNYAGDAGSATAYKITEAEALRPIPDSLYDGYRVTFKASNACAAGGCTLQIGSLDAKALKKNQNAPLQRNDIKANQIIDVVYDSANDWFQIISELGSASMSRAWVKFNGTGTSKTITNAVDTATDQLTITGHGLTAATNLDNVARVSVRTSGGGFPTSTPSLAANTVYYARVVDANTITLHTTAQGALDNTSRIDLTGNGTGTNTMDYITINASYGVDAVLGTSAAGSLVAGDYSVYWGTTFGGVDYALFGMVKSTGSPPFVLEVSNSDAGLATAKRIETRGTNSGTLTNCPEVYVCAFGAL